MTTSGEPGVEKGDPALWSAAACRLGSSLVRLDAGIRKGVLVAVALGAAVVLPDGGKPEPADDIVKSLY